MEWELSGFTNRPNKHEQAHDGYEGFVAVGGNECGELGKVEGAKYSKNQEEPEHKPKVCQTVKEECLLARTCSTVGIVVIADEQIGAQTNQFPSKEDEKIVVADNQKQHRKYK